VAVNGTTNTLAGNNCYTCASGNQGARWYSPDGVPSIVGINLAPGATQSSHYSATPWLGKQLHLQVCVGSNSTWITVASATPLTTNGMSGTVNSSHGCYPTPQTNCTTITMRNDTGVVRWYQVVKNCTPICSAYKLLAPGQSYSWLVCAQVGQTDGYHVRAIDPDYTSTLVNSGGCSSIRKGYDFGADIRNGFW